MTTKKKTAGGPNWRDGVDSGYRVTDKTVGSSNGRFGCVYSDTIHSWVRWVSGFDARRYDSDYSELPISDFIFRLSANWEVSKVVTADEIKAATPKASGKRVRVEYHGRRISGGYWWLFRGGKSEKHGIFVASRGQHLGQSQWSLVGLSSNCGDEVLSRREARRLWLEAEAKWPAEMAALRASGQLIAKKPKVG